MEHPAQPTNPGLEQTIWRSLRVAHPASWELIRATNPPLSGRCVFADRIYQRLEVRWHSLTYRPPLQRLLDKHRDQSEKAARVEPLATAPPPFSGLIHPTEDGAVVHAVRFFEDIRTLVEVAIVWPGQRRIDLENAILTGIGFGPTDGPQQWLAMGLDVTVPQPWKLSHSNARLGRVTWEFTDGSGASLAVERLAMPEYWLTQPLNEWVIGQLPAGSNAIDDRPVTCNGHTGHEVLSWSKIGPISALRGIRSLRRDRAWLCPVERRVFRTTTLCSRRGWDIDFPAALGVRCCQKAPQVKAELL